MILLFVFILIAIYSYLPLRALQNPIINWGNPFDWERIYRHITGRQYQVWLFSSFDSAGKQFSHFWSILPFEFFIGLLLAVVGLFVSIFKSRKLAWFILITFVFTLLYSINYDINDIDSYFLLAFVMLAFFSAFGVLKILEMKSIPKNYRLIGLAVVIAIQFFFNFIKVNQSGVYTFEDYTKAVLNTVPKNAIIFSYQWDYFISASYYYQFVEDYRKDVTVIDKELLRRSWYYNQINNHDSKVLSGIKNEIDQFKKALQPFERDETFDSNRLENLYQIIMSNLIKTNIKGRDYFIAPELIEQEMKRGEFKLPEGYTLVPHLLLYKVVEGNDYVPAPDPDFIIRIASNRNIYIDKTEDLIGRMLSNRAYYEAQNGRSDRAKLYLKKILNDLPGFKLHPALLEVLKN
jgi:tetratricopeptide (TPR) repeat protein